MLRNSSTLLPLLLEDEIQKIWIMLGMMTFSFLLSVLIVISPTIRLRYVSIGISMFLIANVAIWYTVLHYMRQGMGDSGMIILK